MIMIIGGAYAGKLGYAQTQFIKLKKDDWIPGEQISLQDFADIKGVNGLHLWIRKEIDRELKANGDRSVLDWEEWGEQMARQIIALAPNLIIITDELGYGIVPMDKTERIYREVTGRICTSLAAYSDEVHRVICGIGTRIK